MPKKKKDQGHLAFVALQLLAAILLLASFLAILILAGAWLYFEWAIKVYRGVKGRSDFQLLPADQQRLDAYFQAKARIESRIDAINARKRTLPLRTDGSFDSRNKEGKSLNSELQVLRAELEQCDQTIDELSAQEEHDFKRWITIKSGLYCSRAALIAAPVIAAMFCVSTPLALVKLSSLIEQQTGLHSVANVDAFYGIFVATSAIVTIMFLLSWVICRLIFSR